MQVVKAGCDDVFEWRKWCRRKYIQPLHALKTIVAGQSEWQDRVKRLKLGAGSTGTLASKGTCSKGGRFCRQGGEGARRQGAGRKGHFDRVKLQV